MKSTTEATPRSSLPDGSLILHIARCRARRTLPDWASPADIADRAGYLALVICERVGAFDPARADFSAFCHVVAATAAINRWQHETSPVRDSRRTILVRDTGALIDGAAPDATPTDHDLRLDVGRVVHALPKDQRRLCEVLVEHPKEEAARQLGVSKGKLYRDVDGLRRTFAGRGLGVHVMARRRISEAEGRGREK